MCYAKKWSDPLTNHTFSERALSSAHFDIKYDMIGASLTFFYNFVELYPIQIENLWTVAADTPEYTTLPLLKGVTFQKQFSGTPIV